MRMTLAVLAALCLAVPAGAQPRAAGAERLMQLDADGDGAISRAEAQNGRALMFAALDDNEDGRLDEAERTGAERGARMLARADSDGDGTVTEAEFMGQPYRLFDRFDGDENGLLDGAELDAIRGLGGL